MKFPLMVTLGAVYVAVLLGVNQDVYIYMDEMFHVPQAQRYCNGNFNSYDPKITTPPGLYILSLLMYWVSRLGGSSIISFECSTTFLRCTNGVISLVMLPVLLLLRSEMYPPPKARSMSTSWTRIKGKLNSSNNQELEVQQLHMLHSLVIFMYPVSAFFYALYYTDSASLLMFLSSYYLSLLETRRDQNAVTSPSLFLSILSKTSLFLSSSLAILSRQTNAVWLMFIFGKQPIHPAGLRCCY